MLCLSSEEFNISREAFNDPQPPWGFTQGMLPLQASLHRKLSLSLRPPPPRFVACHVCGGEAGWVALFCCRTDGCTVLALSLGSSHSLCVQAFDSVEWGI